MDVLGRVGRGCDWRCAVFVGDLALQPDGLTMKNIPVVMMSCDPYADIWNASHAMWRKMWPDCPMRLFWVSNERVMRQDGVTAIVTGFDPEDWCGNLRIALDRIGAERVFLALDDLWMSRPVDTTGVLDAVSAFRAEGWDHLRFLSDWPSRDNAHLLGNVLRVRLPPTTPYRVSSILGLWKTSTLRAIARPGRSIWDFEVRGTLAAEPLPLEMWIQRAGVIRYDNAVVQGRWTGYGHRMIGEHNLPVDFSARGVEPKRGAPTVRDMVYRVAPWFVHSAIRRHRVRLEAETTKAILEEL